MIKEGWLVYSIAQVYIFYFYSIDDCHHKISFRILTDNIMTEPNKCFFFFLRQTLFHKLHYSPRVAWWERRWRHIQQLCVCVYLCHSKIPSCCLGKMLPVIPHYISRWWGVYGCKYFSRGNTGIENSHFHSPPGTTYLCVPFHRQEKSNAEVRVFGSISTQNEQP